MQSNNNNKMQVKEPALSAAEQAKKDSYTKFLQFYTNQVEDEFEVNEDEALRLQGEDATNKPSKFVRIQRKVKDVLVGKPQQ